MEKSQVLIPVDADVFWQKMREVIAEVVNERDKNKQGPTNPSHLLKVKEICDIFQVTKPTIYDWIRNGQLRSVKIESRRFFLYGDIE